MATANQAQLLVLYVHLYLQQSILQQHLLLTTQQCLIGQLHTSMV